MTLGRQHIVRNSACMVDNRRLYFGAVGSGFMAVKVRSTGRKIVFGADPLSSRSEIADFGRCSHPSLNGHLMILAGSIDGYQSLHWSCKRTARDFHLPVEPDVTMSELLCARDRRLHGNARRSSSMPPPCFGQIDRRIGTARDVRSYCAHILRISQAWRVIFRSISAVGK